MTKLRAGKLDPQATARSVAASEAGTAGPDEASTRGDTLLKLWLQLRGE
jgi:hypothetical protein